MFLWLLTNLHDRYAKVLCQSLQYWWVSWSVLACCICFSDIAQQLVRVGCENCVQNTCKDATHCYIISFTESIICHTIAESENKYWIAFLPFSSIIAGVIVNSSVKSYIHPPSPPPPKSSFKVESNLQNSLLQCGYPVSLWGIFFALGISNF